MLSSRTIVLFVFCVLVIIVCADSRKEEGHTARHRHDYYRRIREYLRRRRTRLRKQGMKLYPGVQPTEAALPVYENTTPTPSLTPSKRKSIQKLKHYFYPKDPVRAKIDEIRKTERKFVDEEEELVTTQKPVVDDPSQRSDTGKHQPRESVINEAHKNATKLPDPDAVLRGLGVREKEIEKFHHSKNVDFLHHSKILVPDKQLVVEKSSPEQEPIVPYEKFKEGLRYDEDSDLPILDKPLYEMAPDDDKEFRPVRLPSGFRHYDIDRDEFVSKDELVLITGAEEGVEEVFRVADMDGDDRLSRREFHRAPWRLQGDPRRNSEVDKIRADIERELAMKARQLHLDYIPRVTISARERNDEQTKPGTDSITGKVGRSGLWYSDDGTT